MCIKYCSDISTLRYGTTKKALIQGDYFNYDSVEYKNKRSNMPTLISKGISFPVIHIN